MRQAHRMETHAVTGVHAHREEAGRVEAQRGEARAQIGTGKDR